MTEDAAATPGLRARKRIATRQALAWSALSLALEHGLDNVRNEDIAAEAQVSPRTFSNYFPNKYAAISGIAVQRYEAFAENLARRPPAEPIWRAVTESVVGQYVLPDDADADEARDWSRRSEALFAEPALRAEYLRARETGERLFAEAIAARLGSADPLLPRLLAGTVGLAVDVMVERWRESGGSPRRVLRAALREAGRFLSVPD